MTKEEQRDRLRLVNVPVRGSIYDCLSFIKQSVWEQNNEEVVAVALRFLATQFTRNKNDDLNTYENIKKLL